MFRRVANIWQPERFQGASKRRSYFEGYYVKVVDVAQDLAFALIPGVSYDAAGAGHAFVQLLDGVEHTAAYHRFESSEFAYAKTGFGLSLAGNRFSDHGVRVEVPGASMELRFRENTPFPDRWYAPGAMGPFAFAPGMQCKHGVVSMHHAVSGRVRIGDRELLLSPHAAGYIEKDWGSSFPRSWLWLQTNHFVGDGVPSCLLVSSGVVPWITGAFEGFIAGLYHGGDWWPFTTYGGAELRVEHDRERVVLDFARGRQRLRVVAHHGPGTELVSPVPTEGMGGKVTESLRARGDLELRVDGRVELARELDWMGLEVAGG